MLPLVLPATAIKRSVATFRAAATIAVTKAEMQLQLAFPASPQSPGAAASPPRSTAAPWQSPLRPWHGKGCGSHPGTLQGTGEMLTFRISRLPNRSVSLLNLSLSRAADTGDCVNQITAHDSANFSIPPLLTFTRAIYRLLKLPLPPSNPRGIPARGGTLLREQMPSFKLQSLSSILQRQPPDIQTTRLFKLPLP